MTSSSGPRAASEMSIVFFAPSFAITVPAGMPKIAIGSISAASTQPIFAVDPVVTRTKNGSATNVIDEPVSDTSSAVIRPRRERSLSMPDKIIRTYGFVNATIQAMPKVTEEHLEARRGQILDGARRAFAQYGFDGATVARLEEAIGLSRGAIFHYFEDKKDLFLAVAEDVNRRFIALITQGGLAEALRELAREDPELMAVLFETEARLRHDTDFVLRMEATSQEMRPLLEAWFTEQVKSGAFRTDIGWPDLARFATIVTNGLAIRIAGGDETDVETVVRLLEDALRPQPGG